MNKALETILKPDVQEILDSFSSLFNIRILFYSPAGDHLSVGMNRPDSSYCMLMRHKLYGEHTCLSLDKAKRDEATTQRSMISYTCHAGLMEAIKPVIYSDRLLGYVMIGQFRSSESVPSKVGADWSGKYDLKELQAAYDELPMAGTNRIEDILRLFSILVDYIVMQHMVVVRGDSSLDDLLEFMKEHIGEDMTLERAASHVNKSPSTVSHMFKARLGKSFKQTLIEMRIERAEQYMICTPKASISEASGEAGYDDPLYFSRIYKRYRGFPPSQFCVRSR